MAKSSEWPRYSAYKDSGERWLGRVPSHWLVDRLKWTVDGCFNGLWGDEATGADDLVVVRVADFDRERRSVSLNNPTRRAIPKSARTNRLLRRGDLLLEKSGGGENQPVGVVVLYDHDEPAVCSNFVARMPVRSGFSPRFLMYVHHAIYSHRLNARSIKQSTGIQNLDSTAYLNERGAFPPFGEQVEIAAYLDRETDKVDRLIAKQARLIELLTEKRNTVISRATTKGLNPSVSIKESGIPWLGSIPTHWSFGKTRHFARLESGHTPSRSVPAYWENCTIPWFSLGDVWQIRQGNMDVVTDTKEKISELGMANSAARRLPAGTVMLSRTASVGFAAIMGVPMATTQDFANWICGPKLRPEYLLNVFRAMRSEFDRLMVGSTHQTIYMPDIIAMSCPLPPIEEQDAIVAFIKQETTKIDALIGRCRRAIDLLREHRASLISALVTGKFRVTEHVQVPEELVAA